MASQFLIYGLVDPRSEPGDLAAVRYVGRSSSGLRRPLGHKAPKSLAKFAHTPKGVWIQELLDAGVQYSVVVLEKCERKEDLTVTEKFWILQLESLGSKLTNATVGGEGATGRKLTEAHKRKIGAANSGPRNANFGRPRTLAEKQHHSTLMKGRRRSPESCVKASRSMGCRAVVDSNGVVYLTVAEAARSLGFDASSIGKALKNPKRSVGSNSKWRRGLTFRYINSDEAAEGAVPAPSTNAAPTVTKD